ncbi:ubiquinol-cytochrome c reductase iron-sulfur subunit [Quatrionicoccus australiensis]|uniref:ubiquinol-cytochrome c reductase iron-sulfur subunit n=1 Tax=Quatrionicoccus australiensis TaxID=138118 RepID=UPI001CF81ABF|nr:ubiquinol-cytochrome c reductase iron-sulfur subunit [Quatrionicoccus australiensis]UCV13883.1 ubiquinol-cytochrome c reductase iron-sulfur subunit [Quatrionicoccus australiensis]
MPTCTGQAESFCCSDSPARRRWLMATAGLGGALTLTALTPFVSSLLPSERAKAAGAPVEVEIDKLAAGDMMIVEWRGKPVWILHRTPEMLAALKKAEPFLADPASEERQQPDYATNEYRSRKPELLVAIGICTHLGCSPSKAFDAGDAALGADWPGGFLCPCHGSTFDFAGRVFKNKPAPTNLEIPPHRYLSDSRLIIGSDEAA